MEIVQKTSLVEHVNGKKISLVFDQDVPLGSIHDALMIFKGFCVDRMAKAHSEHEEEATEKMEEPKEE